MLSVCIYFLFAAASVMGVTMNRTPCMNGDTGAVGHCTPLEACTTARKNLGLDVVSFPLCSTNEEDLQVCCTNSTKSSDVRKIPKLVDSTGAGQGQDKLRVNQKKCEDYTRPLETTSSNSNYKVVGATIGTCMDPPRLGIIGGQDALQGEFPHMAQVGALDSTDNDYGPKYTWLCGGSLIAPSFVVTHARCIHHLETHGKPVVVTLGEYLDQEELKHRLLMDVQKFYKPPGYNATVLYDDIGLLQLADSAAITRAVRPACLWNKFDVLEDQLSAFVTGWGRTKNDENNMWSAKLQKLSVPLMSKNVCNKYIDEKKHLLKNWQGVRDTQLCAGYLKPGKGICFGDTGGPLQVPHIKEDQSCYYYVMGVASFSTSDQTCVQNKSPTVYSRVSAFLDWLECTVWPEEL